MSARKVILAIAVLASINILLAASGMVNGQWSMVNEQAAPADTVPQDGKPRYSVRKTGTEDTKSLRKKTADLKEPDNLKTEVIYDEKDDTYTIGTSFEGSDDGSGKGQGARSRQQGASRSNAGKSQSTTGQASATGAAGATSGSLLPGRSGFTLGTATSFLNAPILMTPEEYQKWSLQNSMQQYWRSKNEEAFESSGKNKFDFTDMHFNLGPAEKIFGPGGVQIKTQGSAELKVGVNIKKVNNPALAASRRKTVGFDFDEKINLSLNGKVGDKINLNLNYNTQATFDYDAQNLKLKYDGKEDEIVKLIEGGNVSFPSNISLVPGVSSLFGLRTDLQFGKLKIQSVISQKKSASSSVNSKGGDQTTNFEFSATNYEENRHFFLSHFFRERYDKSMESLPTISSGINIKRVEIWVTNKSGKSENNRNIIALADLGEPTYIYNRNLWTNTGINVPSNRSNSEYESMVNEYADARDISQATIILDGIGGGDEFHGSIDYEKLQSARKLASTEYTINNALGYVSLSSTLQVDDVLAVAYEYTYMGTTYQVGEFASDLTDTSQALFVKLLTGTTGSPALPTWRLMMKNVYYLGTQKVMSDKFRLDIKYQSDSTGVYLSYLPEEKLKNTILLRALNLDRLDAKNNSHPNGQFDFVEGYTISKGRIFFPVAEPFGEHLAKWIGDPALANKYCFRELYDSTKTVAKQIAEHDKFLLTGRFKGNNAGEIDLGVTNVARGSVVVTAGGTTLTENTDYTVDYNMGRVTIINQSLLDAGTNISASVESNDTYGMQRKTMLGFNVDYEFNKNFTIGGTLMYLSEQPLTTKVSMGNEPLKNTLWGFHISWKKESQWLTNIIDKLPLIQCTQPSFISFNGEFAQLIAGQNHSVQGDASYLDDFESSSIKNSLTQPTYWSMSSTPSMFAESKMTGNAAYGYNRALLAWYYVDPIFTRRSSTLTPSHIKSDLAQLSSHYVREVYERELYPQKAQNSYTSATNLNVLNLAFYPQERGAYNLTTNVDEKGHLLRPEESWGGMMRKLDNTDFEAQNIEYIEFWMMDPFIYKRNQPGNHGGDLYFNLGEVSEDILKDGKKYFESGMPVDGNPMYYTEGYWGRIPNSSSVTYAFNNEAGARAKQDVGFNGLNDEEERNFSLYADYLQQMQGKVSQATFDSIYADPANDNYHYYRGPDFDNLQTSILNRYKRINMPQGNSADSDTSPEAYETAWKSTPDVEDINQDYTLNEYEKYYQYHVSIRPEDMVVGRNHIADMRTASVKLRNGNTEECTWYLFRIPLKEYESIEGNIRDFTSIRFMRIFMTGFQEETILRLATLDLVQGDWRTYQQPLGAGNAPSSSGGTLEVSTVCIEENNDKKPVNYVLPPGITRVTDPSQSQLVEANEQAMCMVARNLGGNESKAVYKNCNYDMRQYKHLQMYVHANALAENVTSTTDGECAVFIRLGSDYKNNYYEYEVPLTLTPEGYYDTYSSQGCLAVWPEENMVDINFDIFTSLKKQRNAQASAGIAAMNRLFSTYDEDHPNNRVSIMGNPTLGEVKTIMIGVRNNSGKTKSIEVWANELRLQEFSNSGGWAAQGNLQVQLSDLGSVTASAKMITSGFGGIEQSVAQRKNEDNFNYSVTTNFDLGRLLPEKAKLTFPIYYSYSKEKVSPKYNPFDTDMLLSDALDALANDQQRDSLRSLTTHTEVNKNLSISGVRLNISTPKHPMPYDPANFTFGYSRSMQSTEGETTVYEHEQNWKASINYSWSPNWKPWEPFKNLKGKSKWLDIIKAQNLAYAPQSITFSTDMNRTYYELQERDLENPNDLSALPATFSQNWTWNRNFSLKWDVFKALHFSFQSGTKAEIEEPYTQVNKDLYPDRYEAWKDSVKWSLRHFGRPLDYSQNVQISYKVPLDKIPIFDWASADAAYTSNYSWKRGAERAGRPSLGNTINTQRTINVNGKFDMEKLYNHSPFLKETNKRFSAANARAGANQKRMEKEKEDKAKKAAKEKEKDARKKAEQESMETGEPVDSIMAKQQKKSPLSKQSNVAGVSTKKKPENKGFVQEITLYPDSDLVIAHGQKSKRIRVTARDSSGFAYNIKFKKVDENSIRLVKTPVDTTKVRLNVVALPKASEQKWYGLAQTGARFLMMVRNISISYRNTYNLSVPGFLPEVGDMLGQKRVNGMFTPGVDFAFGFVDDSYLDKAKSRGWLLGSDSVATPATTAQTEDVQVKMTLEPFTDLKIDLNMSRTDNRNKSIQYMYGTPPTHSGSFNMTTISIGTAFASGGSASNGYFSRPFQKFQENLDVYQQRVEAQYRDVYYPAGTGMKGKFNPENGTVNKYSADVMVPAFLDAYTGTSSLDIFPSLLKMLPNWSVNYKGLSNLPWVRDHFKSVNLTHAYKSIYAVGSYNSYSSWQECMGTGGLGFIQNTTTGSYTPNTLYDVSTVSINESFSPLIGINATLNNNMTFKLEYKTTRVLNLSMTSAQLTETGSKDFVIGWGYKINDFRLGDLFRSKRASEMAAKNVSAKGKGKGAKGTGAMDGEVENTSKKGSSSKQKIAHDLNLRFDFSIRNQSAIKRDLQTSLCEATSGSMAIKASAQVDYTMSRMVTLSLYYDRQRSEPLLSSSSYPTITQDFGFTMKFSLTR